MDVTTLDERSIRDTVNLAVDCLISIPDRHRHPFLADFPTGSCDVASFVIGHLLTDRSLGEWHVVTYESAGSQGQSARHTWLELPNPSGEILFTVDATLHQFSELSSSPYIDGGRSPALRRFTTCINNEAFTKLSEGRWLKPMFSEPLEHVRSASPWRPDKLVKQTYGPDGPRPPRNRGDG